jgi:carbamoyl-phosphate synthase large subunit
MAMTTRALRQARGLLLRDCTPVARPSLRSFSSPTSALTTRQHLLTSKTPSWQHVRKFHRSTRRCALVEEAPRPEAYLESGVIEYGKNLVDVKKVIVIGSGGLSIGQAGEFDYSGM